MSKFVRFLVRFLLSKCPYTRYLSSQIALERGVARVCAFSTEVDNGVAVFFVHFNRKYRRGRDIKSEKGSAGRKRDLNFYFFLWFYASPLGQIKMGCPRSML